MEVVSDGKNEIDFINSNKTNILKHVKVINKVKVGSYHRMVRNEIRLNLRRERIKLLRKPQPNLANFKTRATEFSLNIQNRYSFLSDEDNIDQINKQFNNIIKEAALEVGGKDDKQNSSKLSVETKQLMQKHMVMKTNITTEEIKRALKGMKRGKTPGEDGIDINLVIDAGEIATLLTNCTKVITARISDSLDSNQLREQAEFRRGDTMSPKLFTACLEEIFKKQKWNRKGIKIGDIYLNNPRFVDIVFAESAN
ncbi:uncharacterized protein [Penaeus vannamei]|uniref:uncharacterized protein n=1 Tax=Penaeus vannamei TaxID=6689 RepID=UPI00387F9F00